MARLDGYSRSLTTSKSLLLDMMLRAQTCHGVHLALGVLALVPAVMSYGQANVLVPRRQPSRLWGGGFLGVHTSAADGLVLALRITRPLHYRTFRDL